MFRLAPWKEPVRENPYPLATMRNEFKTLFDRFFGGWPIPFEPETKRFWNLELEEKEKEVCVRAEAPGFEAEEFDVEVRGDILMLKAEHKHEVKAGDKKYEYTERKYERYVTLPAPVEAEKVEAFYRNGILEVHLLKTEETKTLRIPVKK